MCTKILETAPFVTFRSFVKSETRSVSKSKSGRHLPQTFFQPLFFKMHNIITILCSCIVETQTGAYQVRRRAASTGSHFEETWSMAYGSWFMVYGLWHVVYGVWFMVCGSWFMVFDLWFQDAQYDHVSPKLHCGASWWGLSSAASRCQHRLACARKAVYG